MIIVQFFGNFPISTPMEKSHGSPSNAQTCTARAFALASTATRRAAQSCAALERVIPRAPLTSVARRCGPEARLYRQGVSLFVLIARSREQLPGVKGYDSVEGCAVG